MNICPSFARTPFYLVYDNESKKEEYLDNTAAASQGGAGIIAAQLLVDDKIDVVLTPRCGKNSADVLSAAGIRLYKTQSLGAEENLVKYLEGNLDKLDNIHPGFHIRGNRR